MPSRLPCLLEIVGFIYDYLKTKKYKSEENGEPWYVSRCVIPVLAGNKIVCMGYAELFKSLLEETCIVETLDMKKYGNDVSTHVRNILYIKDDKYEVEGNFICDVTFDVTLYTEDTINNYQFFLKTIEEMNEVNFSLNYERVGYDFLDWKTIEKLEKELPEMFTEEEYNCIVGNLKVNYNTALINMNKESFYIETKGNKKEELMSILKLIYKSFNRTIEYKKMIEIFYTLRKTEYYLDPEHVPFTYEDIVSMLESYLSFSYYHHYIEEAKDKSDGLLSERDIISNLIEECIPDIKVDIERVKLTRQLRSLSLYKKIRG